MSLETGNTHRQTYTHQYYDTRCDCFKYRLGDLSCIHKGCLLTLCCCNSRRSWRCLLFWRSNSADYLPLTTNEIGTKLFYAICLSLWYVPSAEFQGGHFCSNQRSLIFFVCWVIVEVMVRDFVRNLQFFFLNGWNLTLRQTRQSTVFKFMVKNAFHFLTN